MLAFIVEDQPHRSVTHFGGKLVRRLAHDGSTFSGVGASGKPGAVQKVSKDEILEDKKAYFSRRSRREFKVHEDSLHAKCQKTICAVIGTYDYYVSSPERGKETSGTAEFSYILDFSDRLRIVHEDGEVVRH